MESILEETQKTVRTIENANSELFYSILEESFGMKEVDGIEIIQHDFYTHFLFTSNDETKIEEFNNATF